MPTLKHYKQTYPALQRAWDKFDKLLDKEVLFFKPKSHNERIKRYTTEVDTKAQIAAIQAQVGIYDKRPWYSKVWFWLFDLGDISVKKSWLSYHSFRQQAHFELMADNAEVTLPQLETLQSEINTHLSSLARSSWRKVVKRFLKALGELVTKEKTLSAVPVATEIDPNHPTPEAAMQKHNSKLAGNKPQDALMTNYGQHLRKKNTKSNQSVGGNAKQAPEAKNEKNAAPEDKGEDFLSYVYCCQLLGLEWQTLENSTWKETLQQASTTLASQFSQSSEGKAFADFESPGQMVVVSATQLIAKLSSLETRPNPPTTWDETRLRAEVPPRIAQATEHRRQILTDATIPTASSAPPATPASSTSQTLVMSRGDGKLIQASVDDEKSYNEASWSYVFCCSFFELDWKEKDKEVLRQNFNQKRRALQLQIHPDKLPQDKFPTDWQNREYWMAYIKEGRTDSFQKLAMIAEGLQILLDNIIPYPTEAYQQSIVGQRKLAEAAATGHEFRQVIFKKTATMEEVVEINQGIDRVEENSERMRAETQRIEESRERMQQETQRIEESRERMQQETKQIEQRGDFLASVLIKLPGGQEELAKIDAELAAVNNQPKQETTTVVDSQTPATEPERPAETLAATSSEFKATSPATQALIARWQEQGPVGGSGIVAPKQENDSNTPAQGSLSASAAATNNEVEPPPNVHRRSLCSPC